MPWFIYIIKCRDKTLYTGITNNLTRRIKAHNSGNGCRYTKYRWPVRLIHYEEYSTKPEALKREARIKSLPRKNKLQLCRKGGNLPRTQNAPPVKVGMNGHSGGIPSHGGIPKTKGPRL